MLLDESVLDEMLLSPKNNLDEISEILTISMSKEFFFRNIEHLKVF